MAMTAAEKREARAAEKAAKASPVENLNEYAMLHPDKVAAASGKIIRPQSAGAKVTVGLILGVSYYNIQLSKIVEKFEQNPQGGRTIKEAVRVGDVVRLRGTQYPRGTVPDGFPEPPIRVGHAALNMGVDKEFWDQWVEQNKLHPFVVNGIIFADESYDRVVAMAKEKSGMVSGLEPINPKAKKGSDPRLPRSVQKEVTDVEAGVR